MEEVDRILLNSLRQSGADIAEDVESVRQLTTELIVECVVRCLRILNPALGNGVSHLLPPGMSARFRIGMCLAQACQELGYQGEIGYQTFLYSNEPEIRRLLMFLVEKLPRDSADTADQPAEKSVLLQRLIATKIKQQLASAWLPPALRTTSLLNTQNSCLMNKFHSQALSLVGSTEGHVPRELWEYWEQHQPPVTAQAWDQACVAASVLERATADLSAVQEWEAEWNSQGLVSRLSPEEYKARKRQRLQSRIQEYLKQSSQRSEVRAGLAGTPAPDLTDPRPDHRCLRAKHSRFIHTEKFTFTQEADKDVSQSLASISGRTSSKDSQEDVQAEQQKEVRELEKQLKSLGEQIQDVRTAMETQTLTVNQAEEETRDRELSAEEKQQLLHIRKRALDLLPDAEGNLSKLQAVMEASAQRLVSLAGQWEKHRVPLIAEHRRLKQQLDSHELESSRRLMEIKEFHEKIKTSAEEAKRKENVHRQLILSDTKELQKEINSLTGKLDRTFAVTDELLFKDAKRDEAVRKAYKYLAALHENCSQLIETIEDTGTILREVRDLEELIDLETGKKTLINLEKILEDHRAIRQENAGLAGRLREA
ncbi:coiled-coil domain-containing protein 22 isoform X2 [Callorhinchus milii]|uniref:Coiled-coil domain-containing protein 22 n=1 Tax=Callorhinchus milii TaxID=7868 RepID=A0A4W3JWU9_CALMI|nr:coiled-coil domain-containing protein 22 isoform X2 [Callorhinchus milii]|eukprot:gi/632978745/ref/XP_007906087.1/ PREDICTED: coiled-coil domain-containing protein 22 isoform X2 [Callorhinchus milii]